MLSSTGEIKIHQILSDAGIPFEEEYEFPDLKSSSGRNLRFDFAIFDDEGNLECLIEFNGKQHYSPIKKFGGARGLYRQQYNDSLKKQYCIKNRLRLVSIPYYDEPKLSYDYLMRAMGY